MHVRCARAALRCVDPAAQVVVTRGQPVQGPPGPIVVATRNDALQGVLDATPADRREGISSPSCFAVCSVLFTSGCHMQTPSVAGVLAPA